MLCQVYLVYWRHIYTQILLFHRWIYFLYDISQHGFLSELFDYNNCYQYKLYCITGKTWYVMIVNPYFIAFIGYGLPQLFDPKKDFRSSTFHLCLKQNKLSFFYKIYILRECTSFGFPNPNCHFIIFKFLFIFLIKLSVLKI